MFINQLVLAFVAVFVVALTVAVAYLNKTNSKKPKKTTKEIEEDILEICRFYVKRRVALLSKHLFIKTANEDTNRYVIDSHVFSAVFLDKSECLEILIVSMNNIAATSREATTLHVINNALDKISEHMTAMKILEELVRLYPLSEDFRNNAYSNIDVVAKRFIKNEN